jgi:hypothetical protein
LNLNSFDRFGKVLAVGLRRHREPPLELPDFEQPPLPSPLHFSEPCLPASSYEVAEASTPQQEASTEQQEESLTDQQRGASTEAGSPCSAEIDRERQSGDSGDSETASNNSGHLKVSMVAALAGISYNFGPSKIMKTCIGSMESYARYFLKGYAPDAESEPEPRVNEAVILEDFFAAGLRMPPHLVPMDILHKF